jgi:uncharacterized protein YuzE
LKNKLTIHNAFPDRRFVEISEGVVVDFDSEGNIVGIDLI